MTVYKRNNGVYYCSIPQSGGKRISLRTSNYLEAKKRFALIKNEVDLMLIYHDLLLQNKRILEAIDARNTNLIREIERHGIVAPRPKNIKTYSSEDEFQNAIMPFLRSEYGLMEQKKQLVIGAGIVDLYGVSDGKAVIVEFKLGHLSERYLGQCLRYLGDPSIKADELWLIGEKRHPTTWVYSQYDKIKLFVANRSNRAKKPIRKIDPATRNSSPVAHRVFAER